MTIASEAIASFAVADTNRIIVVGADSDVDATGLQAVAVAGQSLTATFLDLPVTGYGGSMVYGQALSATLGQLDITGLQGAVVAGQSLTAVYSDLDVTGLSGSLVVGVSLIAVLSGYDVTGYAGSVTSGGVLSATVGSVTVQGFEATITYTVAERPDQVQIFDLVNIALNDALGTVVYYIKDGQTYTLDGLFTDESQAIGFDGEVISTAPQVTIRRANMPYGNAPKQNEVLSVHSRTYVVWDWRLDDSDAYLIMLKARH